MARIKYVDGIEVTLTAEEEEALNLQEAEWEAGRSARYFQDLRRKRDNRLKATDWRFRSDQNPSQEWIDYCQELRDLPAQYTNESILVTRTPNPDNPDEHIGIAWPTKPES